MKATPINITISLLWSLVGSTVSAYDCPLLGSSFLPPKALASSDVISSALRNLEFALQNTTKLANSTVSLTASVNSFSVTLFDTSSTVYEFQHSVANKSLLAETSTQNVDVDTVYRVGSLSKLLTAYLFLIEAGDCYWDRSVTDFIPELDQAARSCVAGKDPVDCVDWKGVTLGALASHLAGISRDYSTAADLVSQTGQLRLQGQQPTQLGLPPLNSSEIPPCGLTGNTPCSRAEWLQGLARRHPVFAPFTTPIYSNAAFQLLGYALENITGHDYAPTLQTSLFDRLNMTRSSYDQPIDTTNKIIPGDATTSGWNYNVGDEGPAAGIYSTPADFVRLGQSILSHRFLSPLTTRRWMKPSTHTSSLQMSVGKPWEILRTQVSNRVVDLYTKSGDIGSYSAYIVLLPDYEAGFVIMSAGDGATANVGYLADTVTEHFLPALEQAARAQAEAQFAGTYTAAALNSSITLAVADAKSGLQVSRWVSNGTDMLPLVAALRNAKSAVDLRLYPTDLVTENGNGTEIAFRSVVLPSASNGGGVFTQTGRCATWGGVDGVMYGEVAIDDFVFGLDAKGDAVSVEPRVLRATLEKQ